MLDTNQREIAESQFERNQRREAEVEDALKQDRARHEAAVNNMHRLRALRLARDAKSISGAMSAPDSSPSSPSDNGARGA
jgi:hypothetical protein